MNEALRVKMKSNSQDTKSFELLVSFGDRLDATDNVQEFNDIGFNKADKSGWAMVRGDLVAMKAMLKKYEKQLRRRFGDNEVDEIDWTLPEDAQDHLKLVKKEFKEEKARKNAEEKESAITAKVNVTLEGTSELGLLLSTTAKIDRSRFDVFLNATRAIKGARCIRERNYLWVVPLSTDFAAYEAELKLADIALGEIPEIDPKLKQVAITRANFDVVVSLRDDEKIGIKHHYDAQLNAAYKNSEETSGIIGFDWGTKERLVGKEDLQDLDEVLAAVTKFQPTWNVGYLFDIEQHRKSVQDRIAVRRGLNAEITEHLKEGVVPLPYQIEGYNWYKELGGRALNADDMGLGKTFQTLLYAANFKLKTLVICPKNVRRNWLAECEKFFLAGTFIGYEIDSAKTPKDVDLNGYNIVTINYEILEKFSPALLAAGFDLAVIDESHRIKNPKAKTTGLVQSLAGGLKHVICLSGTPLKNKKKEIFTQANLIAPGTFASEAELSWATFFQTKEKIKKFFFRRTKKAELKDLPEKFRSVVKVASGKKLPDLTAGMEIGDISRLKSELAIAKTSLTIEHLEDILENTESKVIVFSDSDDAADIIAKHFAGLSVVHTGSTPHEKREQIKKEFMDENSKIRLFSATTGSCREGVNLTIADRIVFNDLPWTPADLNQAEARAHRLGQRNCVNVYWICAEGNQFDNHVVALLFQKMAIYEKIINGKKPSPKDEEFLSSPLFEIKGKRKA